jgi:uncharacterized membrane protein YuzA (DUF378 family)
MRLRLGSLVLILIGVIFRSINLDVVPAERLMTLLAAWSRLVLILVGLAAMVRPRRAA